MNLLTDFKNIFLNIYIIIPFVMVFIFGGLTFLKNPVYLRRLAKLFYFIQFAFASFLFIGIGETRFSILNISFHYEKFSSILLFTISFIFLIFSMLSKTFILKSHKAFWITNLLIFGLLNTTILSDNILICYLNLIWIFFLFYFLNITFSYSKQYKKNINSQLKLDIGIVAFSICCILYDFLRYFVLNDIEFCFSNISENLYHINSFSTNVAFFGFLILILKLYNLMPFTCKNIENSDKVNPLTVYICSMVQFILATFLFIKTNIIFAYLYYDYQSIIALYLIISLIYFSILAFGYNSIYKFLNTLLIIFSIMNIFSTFVFNESGINTFIYASVGLVFSYSLMFFILAILSNKFKTDNFEEFKRISSKSPIVFYMIFSTLNLIGVPLFATFSSRFSIFVNLFGVVFEKTFMNIVPYILVIACFTISITIYKMFHKVLIAPVEAQKYIIKLSGHQNIVLILLCFSVIVFGLFAQNSFNVSILNINS